VTDSSPPSALLRRLLSVFPVPLSQNKTFILEKQGDFSGTKLGHTLNKPIPCCWPVIAVSRLGNRNRSSGCVYCCWPDDYGARKVVWRILGFRHWSESQNIGIYRAILVSDAEIVAGEWAIVVAHHRRMAYLFHLKHVTLHGVSA
jgi:hypothetical protein